MKLLVCALCGEPGGTFINSPKGKIHQDCERAAAILKRTRRKAGILEPKKGPMWIDQGSLRVREEKMEVGMKEREKK